MLKFRSTNCLIVALAALALPVASQETGGSGATNEPAKTTSQTSFRLKDVVGKTLGQVAALYGENRKEREHRDPNTAPKLYYGFKNVAVEFEATPLKTKLGYLTDYDFRAKYPDAEARFTMASDMPLQRIIVRKFVASSDYKTLLKDIGVSATGVTASRTETLIPNGGLQQRTLKVPGIKATLVQFSWGKASFSYGEKVKSYVELEIRFRRV